MNPCDKHAAAMQLISYMTVDELLQYRQHEDPIVEQMALACLWFKGYSPAPVWLRPGEEPRLADQYITAPEVAR